MENSDEISIIDVRRSCCCCQTKGVISITEHDYKTLMKLEEERAGFKTYCKEFPNLNWQAICFLYNGYCPQHMPKQWNFGY